jgi:tRNA A37 threonylcarbamoyladenosine synthetase subunit TsaC/SUA5/YrdC
MGADLAQLVEHLVGFDWREEWLQEAGRRWPGPFTLVLPAPTPSPSPRRSTREAPAWACGCRPVRWPRPC